MRWDWTGFSRDSSGRERRTGFTWSIAEWPIALRISSFPVPTKAFGVMNRRVCIEIGPLHALLTWRK